MSTIEIADSLLADVREDREAQERRVAAAYRNVFDGQPTKDDQALVMADLEVYCGMRSSLLRDSARETGAAIGRFAVWQRIHNFRFPRAAARPADATRSQGGNHDQKDQPGRGIAEPTVE